MGFCKNCGSTLSANDSFCVRCGSKAEQQAFSSNYGQQPAKQQSATQQTTPTPSYAAAGAATMTCKPSGGSKMPILLAVGAAILVLAIAFGIWWFSTEPTKKAEQMTNQLIQCIKEKDAEEFLDMFPPTFVDELEEQYDSREYAIAEMESELRRYEDFRFRITNVKKMTRAQLRNHQNELADNDVYLDIQAAVRVSLHGEENGEDLGTEDIVVIKVNGTWYLSPEVFEVLF